MTARSKTFTTDAGVLKGAKMMEVYNLDALVVSGGDGSFKGARALARLGVPVIGIPGTIDNDIGCTDYTIGYDTSMNTAMEAIDIFTRALLRYRGNGKKRRLYRT